MPADPIYEALGGASGCRALSAALYSHIKRDGFLRPLFPGKTLHCAIEEFAAFLVQFLGGEAEHTQRRWWVSLHESHRRFRITRRHRDAWFRNMCMALQAASLDASARATLHEFFAQSSIHLINDSPASHPTVAALPNRWKRQLVADHAIEAIRAGDTRQAVELTDLCAAESRQLYCGLLIEMIQSGSPDLLTHLCEKLDADQSLTLERFASRTFLHYAAASGHLALVQQLLRLGTHPDVHDGGGHTPLYAVANQCLAPAGAQIVRALVSAGADVNAHDGVQQTTPLHLAARRNNVDVATALLDCGAALDARDRTGDTPLRRAVNCNQTRIAALLLSRGANPDSVGSKGLTPRSAARTSAMRSLFGV